MPVVHPATYQPKPVTRRRSKAWLVLPLCILLAGAVNYVRPLPAVTTTISVGGLAATTQPSIPWPAGAQAAIAAPDYGILATGGIQKPLATASIAKVITALCVLQKQPLATGQSGPTYTGDKIQASRRFYNSVVRDFNTKRQVFPTSLFAKWLGFKSDKEFFEVDEAEAASIQKPVEVKF